MVLNHYIQRYNNAIRILVKNFLLTFPQINKYDKLINQMKGEDIP